MDMYGYETWSLALKELYRLRVREKKVLRRSFEVKRDEVTRGRKILPFEKLNNLFVAIINK